MRGRTPAMRQYADIKKKHEDSILFFRMGDFYEMFWEDAKTASKELDIVLTSRSSDSSRLPYTSPTMKTPVSTGSRRETPTPRRKPPPSGLKPSEPDTGRPMFYGP